MSMSVYVKSAGMANPVGLSRRASCAAMRANLNGFRELDYVDNEGAPIVGSMLEDVLVTDNPYKRWIELLALAISDSAESASVHSLSDIPLVCVCPVYSQDSYTASDLGEELSALIGCRFSSKLIRLCSGNSPSSFDAIRLVSATLTNGKFPSVFLCASDSLVNARSIERLDRLGRLKTASNSDGVAPGESANCLLLSLDARNSLCKIGGVGSATEVSTHINDLPLRGHGIVAAAREALDAVGLKMSDMDFRISDLAGDSFYFKEQTILVSRLLRQNKSEFPLWLSSLSLGDTGASSGLAGLVLAIDAFEQGYAPGDNAIAYASHDDGQRAALVVSKTCH